MGSFFILATLLLLCLGCHQATDAQSHWVEQRDDLSEYQLDAIVSSVRSDSECAILAESRHQAVQFSSGELGACRLYSCQLGRSGCRKCRNARNSSLPLLLVRRLDELGRNCWRTFQHRVDGSVDFYRNWTDYMTEFGQGEDRNYWMGLEAIHLLTRAGDRRVRWEMSDWNGTRYWWEDAFFAVQGVDQGYRVSVGEQDIDNSNVFTYNHSVVSYMNNARFSTPDKDQDAYVGSCAIYFHSAWWFSNCHCFNPNGRYFTPPTALNLVGSLWATGLSFQSAADVYPLTHSYSMKTFECMVSGSP